MGREGLIEEFRVFLDITELSLQLVPSGSSPNCHGPDDQEHQIFPKECKLDVAKEEWSAQFSYQSKVHPHKEPQGFWIKFEERELDPGNK